VIGGIQVMAGVIAVCSCARFFGLWFLVSLSTQLYKFYTWVEGGTVKLKNVAQEHTAMITAIT